MEPGGVAQDIDLKQARHVLAEIEALAAPFAEIVELYDETPSLQDRTATTGVVGPELIAQWAAGGHVGRASGRSFDARRDLSYAPYDRMTFEVPLFTAGDVDARVWVRIREVETSMRMLKSWLPHLSEGPIHAPLPEIDAPREGMAVVEAFRGDALVWLRLEPDHRIARCHARDASWFQWPLLEAAIEGNIVADFPLCNKSFNLSYCGHDL